MWLKLSCVMISISSTDPGPLLAYEPLVTVLRIARMTPHKKENYTVGWICAVTTEYVAARAFLDKEHARPEYQESEDSNDYTLGEIGNHNVVIAVLPHGEYGTTSATTAATNMRRSFASIRLVLMVGIGGGVPSSKHDIRLGDIVVSTPYGDKGGVIQYDFGNEIQNQNSKKKYGRPDARTDRLYRTDVIHPINDEAHCEITCGDDASHLVSRSERDADDDNPAIYYGLIASANRLMKDALARDRLAAEKGILCFEMEAAGLMNNFPCLVIRGICHYSDTHKSDEWQGYAAMSAAAYAKQLLYRIPQGMVDAEEKIYERLLDNTETLRSNWEREGDRQILNWITSIDYGTQQSDFLDKRQLGTGEWLLRSSEYQGWLKGSKQMLHCPGIPGSGKTFLTSIVVQDLTTQFRNETIIGIAYIYCNFRQKAQQSINHLLASLLKQLAQRQTSLSQSIKSLYSQHEKNQTKLSLDEIKNALSEVANMCSKAAAPVNIFTTSRPIMSIENELKNPTTLQISAKDEEIHLYLDEHISSFQNSISKREGLQKSIKGTIAGAVDGMFLLAHLYLESLRNKMTSREILDALDLFRKKSEKAVTEDQKSEVLTQAYDDAMERIVAQSSERRILAKNFLSWIVFAMKPLTTLQLQHALAVKNGDREFDDQRIPDINDMISICAGLVTIENETRRVRLVHYTTQEYFEHTHANWVPDAAQSYITSTCTTYLALNPFNVNVMRGLLERQLEGYRTRLRKLFKEGELRKLHSILCPFYIYASHYWGHHARHSCASFQELASFLLNQPALKSSLLLWTYPTTERSALWNGIQLFPHKHLIGLHVAAYFGLEKVFLTLPDGYTLDNTHGTLLPCAVGGDVDAQKYEQFYADIYGRDNSGFTPLMHAIYMEDEAAVQLLLDHNADVTLSHPRSGTALLHAMNYGHKVAKLVAEKAIAKMSPDGKFARESLMGAVQHVNCSIIQVLREHDVALDFRDEYGQTPLTTAVRFQVEAVVKLLLQSGVNIDFTDNKGDTALHRAAHGDYATCLQVLLDHNANIFATNEDGQTPESIAAGRGHQEIEELLKARRIALQSVTPGDIGT
ncbi:hypothetical protein F5B20DRAFT_572639 [Whalleya microplaca]|nr:hypothetical protein F5B20DRAFT_572639 [Whalleya microplaca]